MDAVLLQSDHSPSDNRLSGETPAPPSDWRQGRFPHLMPSRIQEVLLVSSAYDSFILEEDGLLTEMVFTEYADLGLTHSPNITRVSNGEEALAALRKRRFDLVITLLRLGSMDVRRFAEAVREIRPGLPVVLLVANEWELTRITAQQKTPEVNAIYVWQGDAKLFVAIIKCLEDEVNADHDTRLGDVGVIIIVEDSVRFRSSLLPIIYSQLVRQTRAVMADGLNHMDKLLRLAARPKLLVARTYEEAIELYQRYRKHLLGVISDVSFPRQGQLDPQAGVTLLRQIRHDVPDIPALLQSSDAANWQLAERLGVSFLHKGSPTLLDDIRVFLLEHFGFGDFVFRLPDGREVARARDLPAMARVLRDIPHESLRYHAEHNHFSIWLRARTEFALARQMRPRRVSEFSDLEALRRYLIRSLNEAQRLNRRGVVEDFAPQRLDTGSGLARLGGGSLGGKARGLAFFDALLAGGALEAAFPDVHVHVPRSLVVGTDVFDEFLDQNGINVRALCDCDDGEIARTFLESRLPEHILEHLRGYLARITGPIAVRSSSLLEDSRYHPFAGVYQTHMLPNTHPEPTVRLQHLCDAVRLVYASVFFRATRQYLSATGHALEQEKMAVILQRVVGSQYAAGFPAGDRVALAPERSIPTAARTADFHYPSFAGVAHSHNYYPFGAMRPEDGVAMVALGLGRTVVEGGDALRFCPAHPHVLPQLADGEAFINHSQRTFYAVDLRHPERGPRVDGDPCIVSLTLDEAERHGTLTLLGSTWSPDDQAFYDGIQRPGIRVVTFAHVLKNEAFPLAAILRRLLQLGAGGMNSPVEIEFAADLHTRPREFAVLQIRPCGVGTELDASGLDDLKQADLLCLSSHSLGHGVVTGLADVIYVKPDRFDPAFTQHMADEIGALNDRLLAENRPCVLIGPGRWGSSHSWLGIPVSWSQICAARVIVETTLADFSVEPSQGSHFFQNLTAFGTAYFSVNPFSGSGFIDWEWLDRQPAQHETRFLRHIRLREPLEARMDGSRSRGAVLKPRVERD